MDRLKVQRALVSSRPVRLYVNAEVPTPFVVPWSWYVKQRLYWQLPKLLCVTVTADGIQDTARYAAIVHEDPQFGLRASFNQTAALEKYAGYHLVSVQKVSPNALHFALSRAACPCGRGTAHQSCGTRKPGAVETTADIGATIAAGGRGPRVESASLRHPANMSGETVAAVGIHHQSTVFNAPVAPLPDAKGGIIVLPTPPALGHASRPVALPSCHLAAMQRRSGKAQRSGSSWESGGEVCTGEAMVMDTEREQRDQARTGRVRNGGNGTIASTQSTATGTFLLMGGAKGGAATAVGPPQALVLHRGARANVVVRPDYGSRHGFRRSGFSDATSSSSSEEKDEEEEEEEEEGSDEDATASVQMPNNPFSEHYCSCPCHVWRQHWPDPDDLFSHQDDLEKITSGRGCGRYREGRSLQARRPQEDGKWQVCSGSRGRKQGASVQAPPEAVLGRPPRRPRVGAGPPLPPPRAQAEVGPIAVAGPGPAVTLRTQLEQSGHGAPSRHRGCDGAAPLRSRLDDGAPDLQVPRYSALAVPVLADEQILQRTFNSTAAAQPQRGGRCDGATSGLSGAGGSADADPQQCSICPAVRNECRRLRDQGAPGAKMEQERLRHQAKSMQYQLQLQLDLPAEPPSVADSNNDGGSGDSDSNGPGNGRLIPQQGSPGAHVSIEDPEVQQGGSQGDDVEQMESRRRRDQQPFRCRIEATTKLIRPNAAAGPPSTNGEVHLSLQHSCPPAPHGFDQGICKSSPEHKNGSGPVAEMEREPCAVARDHDGMREAALPSACPTAVGIVSQADQTADAHVLQSICRPATTGPRLKRPREEDTEVEARGLCRRARKSDHGEGPTQCQPALPVDLSDSYPSPRECLERGRQLLTVAQACRTRQVRAAATAAAAESKGVGFAAPKLPALLLTLPGRPVCRPAWNVKPLNCETPTFGSLIKGTRLVVDAKLLQHTGSIGGCFLRLFVERDGYLDGSTAAKCIKLEEAGRETLALTRLPPHAQNCVFIGWGVLPGGSLVLRVRSRSLDATSRSTGSRAAAAAPTSAPPPAMVVAASAAAAALAADLNCWRNRSCFRSPAAGEAAGCAPASTAARVGKALTFPHSDIRLRKWVRMEDLLNFAPAISSRLDDGAYFSGDTTIGAPAVIAEADA
ncbi:hypothetical protein VaNZ11_004737 [Volvox africanus]|uniref:Uncharacterized protein n=1 Tax=Volvox africanus TaxID=51714 RepID=A0ABQ5RX00_9CHLO|nr:hypothetical protein VaNZ11_004737 [Volvox africanus]